MIGSFAVPSAFRASAADVVRAMYSYREYMAMAGQNEFYEDHWEEETEV